jgi:hypothetical protein
MVFNSYYWHDAHLGESQLEQARAALARDDLAQPVQPFLVLLGSARIAARGIALDHFHYAEATSRFGSANPFWPHRAKVLAAARALLADPPVSRGFEGADIDGANQASALGAMVNLAEPADAARVAEAMETAPNRVVREVALQCAGTILESAPAQPDLSEAIRDLARDSDASDRDRGEALQLLALADPGEAVALALDLVRHPSLRLQADAAWLLAEHDRNRYAPVLASIVAGWPEDAPYPAFEVRQLLED